jgi:hypothetical protein
MPNQVIDAGKDSQQRTPSGFLKFPWREIRHRQEYPRR